MDVDNVPLQPDTPATYHITYHIRLQGVLDESWSDRLQGMTIVVLREANKPIVTTLTGKLIDQAALSSVLNQVYLLGLPVLSVEQITE